MLIIQGDALTELKRLPENSVDCCVTSPPYWGLRDYKIPHMVWGGDPGHAHEWGPEHRKGGPAGAQGSTSALVGRRAYVGGENTCVGASVGCWCECGAWRGALGLEPTPQLYIEHVVMVFREVRRVLRKDGTLWLNMGDSYCSDAGADRLPTTLSGPRVPAGWTNRSQPHRVHAIRSTRHGNDIDPKRGYRTQDRSPLQACMSDGLLKPKDLCMMPARVALALQDDGWYLRCDIIWHKTNPMPESVRDRPTKAHEYLFLLSRSPRYYYDAEAIKEPCTGTAHDRARKERPDKWPNAWSAEPGGHDGIGNGRFVRRLDRAPGVNPTGCQTIATNKPGSLFARSGNKARNYNTPTRLNDHLAAGVPWHDSGTGRNKRSVWTLSTKPFKGAHFATFPPKLIEPCILAGCPKDGIVLDPFGGAFTTALVAQQLGRDFIMIELNPDYIQMGRARLGLDRDEAIA